jgi:hypothetical protein
MATPDDMEEDSEPDDPTPTPGEPAPADTSCDCRYLVILSIPPSTEPWKVFTDLLRTSPKNILQISTRTNYQETTHRTVGPRTRDEDTLLIKKPSDFPEGSARNRKKYVTYFSGYPNPKRGKPSKVYLKV